MSGTFLYDLYLLFHVILTETLKGQCYCYPIFTGEESVTQKIEISVTMESNRAAGSIQCPFS